MTTVDIVADIIIITTTIVIIIIIITIIAFISMPDIKVFRSGSCTFNPDASFTKSSRILAQRTEGTTILGLQTAQSRCCSTFTDFRPQNPKPLSPQNPEP